MSAHAFDTQGLEYCPFMPVFGPPQVMFARGKGTELWDTDGKRYLDCLAQNLCISVGYDHPRVNAAIESQMRAIQHVTTMYYHPGPAQFAEELVATFPAGHDWVVHPVNSGAEAVDLAVLVARLHTGNFDVLALRNSYHGLHFGAMTASGLALCRQPIAGAPGYVHAHNPDLYRGAYGDRVDGYLDDIRRVIDSSTPGASDPAGASSAILTPASASRRMAARFCSDSKNSTALSAIAPPIVGTDSRSA